MTENVVGVRVRDFAAAARFYREAFGVELRAELELEVENLGEAHARAVAAGAEVVTAPHDSAATYRDPDGNLVTLTELAGAAVVAGVDLARGGLAVVVLEENRIVEAFRCESFAVALLVEADVVAVDIPIGIPEAGPREADVAARRFVGARASTVFSTPIRAVLEAARTRRLAPLPPS